MHDAAEEDWDVAGLVVGVSCLLIVYRYMYIYWDSYGVRDIALLEYWGVLRNGHQSTIVLESIKHPSSVQFR